MRNRNLICTSIDDNYLWPWIVTVYTAALNSEYRDFRLVVANVNGMLSENSIRIIGNICRALEIEVEIVPIKTTLQLEFKHQFNITVYSRIFLMDLLDDDFLWLDADLVLMPGWESIFEVMGDRDADDTIIYGVLDAKSSRGKLRVEKNKFWSDQSACC